jgi:hypothetical protein
MVNKGDAVGWEDWRKLPIDEQMGWRIPITTMFNITHLRRTHPVIMISEYLRLHNLSVDMEWSNGAWLRDTYHKHANVFESNPQKKPSLQVIENWWYDPQGINRVDVLPKDMRARGNWSEKMGDPNNGQGGNWRTNSTTTAASRLLFNAMSTHRSVLSWEEARAILQTGVNEENYGRDVAENSTPRAEISSTINIAHRWNVSTDDELEKVLRLNGWEVLYTYSGA